MSPSAKIICDSIYGDERLTTMELCMHRFVLAEFNTHRMFSRNSASSRAIPVEKQLDRVRNNPAFPISWPKEQPGMQGGNELESEAFNEARDMYEDIRNFTVARITDYLKGRDKELTLHKSVVNRMLEPFMWHTVIVTSTEWDNFFEQRCSPLAQPEIRAVANEMYSALENSRPELMHSGAWHLPYISEEEKELYLTDILIRASVARCARVSTLHHDTGTVDVVKDMNLYRKLINAEPPHWSPLEHIAQVNVNSAMNFEGNFQSYVWQQLRHMKNRPA